MNIIPLFSASSIENVGTVSLEEACSQALEISQRVSEQAWEVIITLQEMKKGNDITLKAVKQETDLLRQELREHLGEKQRRAKQETERMQHSITATQCETESLESRLHESQETHSEFLELQKSFAEGQKNATRRLQEQVAQWKAQIQEQSVQNLDLQQELTKLRRK